MEVFLNQFIKYKVHLGHKKQNSSLFSSWFLYKIRTNIWIINLYKTLWMLKLSSIFIKHLVTYNKPIWFINMDFSKQSIINLYANDCGEFACTAIWIRGMISNYFSLLPTIKRYLLDPFLYHKLKLYTFYSKWYLTRRTWPRSLFVSNLKHYSIICKEALSLFIPIIGISDTNVKQQYFNFPIPGNDDNYESLTFICSIISKYILLYKYKKVLLWVIHFRNKYRFKQFLQFINKLKYFSSDLRKFINVKFQLFNKLDYFSTIRYNVKTVFSINRGYNFISNLFKFPILKKLDFYYDLINIGWYKKYILYKNIKRMNIKKFYYILNIYRYPGYRFPSNSWFYFLYFLSYYRYFRIFVETFMSVNIYRFYKIQVTRYGWLLFKYIRRLENWRNKFANRWKFIKKIDFLSGLKNLWSFGSNRFTSLYFKQLYLILFIKFLNFNIFSLRIKYIL